MSFTKRGMIVWALIVLGAVTFVWNMAEMPWWLFGAWFGWILWFMASVYFDTNPVRKEPQ